MARPLRIEFPHAVYHVSSRSQVRKQFVRDDIDRQAFLDILAQVVDRFGWVCHAYCLADHRYYIVIETPQPNLSRGMRQLNGVYTQWFNRRHGREGHVFQGRFKAVLLEKVPYLLELCRFVVLIPVYDKLVKRPDRWRWSSYRATAGIGKIPLFLTVDWILGRFGKRQGAAQGRYRQFVIEGINATGPWEQVRGQMYLGGDRFIANHHPDPISKKRLQRKILHQRPSLKALFRKRVTQDRLILQAYRRYGYRLWEIGDHLGVHYATVSRWLKRAEEGSQ